ncbi:hypothetical protein BJV77DRAFT_1066144 [Russula vinacea]|nr:hypothetical protein BJV77DRAFT_1066144 [Russula vinacea]
MEGNTLLLSPVSYKTPLIFALVRSVGDGRQTEWLNFVRGFTYTRLNRLTGGNLPRRQTNIQFITYCRGSLVSVFPSHILGGDDVVEVIPFDDTTTQDTVALFGYETIIKVIEGFQKGPKQDPNEQFSYHLWHIAAGEYPHFDVSPGPWDPEWNLAYSELMRASLDIDLSMMLINPCPNFRQMFSSLSYIIEFRAFCYRRGNALPYDLHSLCNNAATGSLAPLIAVLHSPHISAAHGTQYMTDATGPVLNWHEGPQSSSPAAVQTQPHFDSTTDMHVPGAQGFAPVHGLVSRHGSGVEQQQQMTHEYMGAFNVSEDLANTNAGNTTLWIGTLFLNGVRAQARAPKTESVRDPMLSAWPNILFLECVAASNISMLDIQAWLREAAAAVVRIDGMDTNFGQFVGEVRKGGDYAIVKWDDQGVTLERLSSCRLATSCSALHSPTKASRSTEAATAATNPRLAASQEGKEKSSPGSQPDPAATETPPDGPHVEAAEADVSSVGSSADSSFGGIPITNSEAIEYEYVNSGDEST